MTTIIRVCDAGGWQDIGESDFPLAVGVSSEGAVVFGSAAESWPAVWFGLNNRQVFLQADGGPVSVRLNGKKFNCSTWLAADDELQIESAKFTVKIDTGVVVLSPVAGCKAPVLTPPDTPLAPDGQTKEDSPLPGEQESTETELIKDKQADCQPKVSAAPHFAPLHTKKGPSRLRNVLIGFFVILLLCVIFVLTATPVRVTITPHPDTVSLSRFPLSVKVGERYLALPGTYHVIAKKAGYRKLEKSINVELGSNSTFAYKLCKLPGLLDVVSQPVKGAEVRVDGNIIGKTPLASIELEAGRHKLSVVAQRYLPDVRLIETQGMGVWQRIDVILQPGWGTLRVESKPGGADVWLNGVVVGRTPLKTERMGGAYKIELRKDGWKPISGNVKIEPGETIKMSQFKLQKVDGMLEQQKKSSIPKIDPDEPVKMSQFESQKVNGMLHLTSKPSGASVMLNGEFRGNTPISLTVMSEKDLQVSLSKSGFLTASRSIRIKEGKAQSIDIQLEPEYGIVFVTSQPADAELTVDGKVMGTASRRLRLTTLPHRIEVSKAGYEPFTTTLTPAVGTSKKLDVQLKSNRQARDDAIPPEIKTAEGQVLRRILLSEPVRFQMGASRRESGRRSNETQYQVELTRTFYVSEKEVTNAEFQKFRQGHNSGSENGFDLNEMDQPVTSVQWDAAAAYLNWLSEKDGLPPAYEEKDGEVVAIVPITTGYRLPTEAEWAFIARYEGRSRADEKPLKYPWGNDRYPSKKNGNYADSSSVGNLPIIIKGYRDGYGVAAPVGRFPPNAAGIYDLGGNVSEWCHDYYDMPSGDQTKALRDPTGPAAGKYHVVRGASWRHGSITELRLSYRDYAEKPRNDLGFRIARYAEK